jgi:hypothetical protein
LVSDNPTLALDAVGPSTPTVHGDRGGLKVLAHGGDERTAHVADHFGDAAGRAAMLGQESAKSDHRLFAAPRGHEHHRLVGTVEIDEHGHISLSALGRGLIQADGRNLAEVQALDGAADIMPDDAPQALISDLDDAGGGQHRHLAHQHQGCLLEQQSEVTALAGPGGGHPQHAVLGAIRAWQLRGDVAVMLEKVQMAPTEFGEVVRLAGLAADRTGKQAAAVGGDLQVEFMWLFAGFQALVDQPPRRRQAKPQRQYGVLVHPRPAHPDLRQRASVLVTLQDAARRCTMAYGHPGPSLRAPTQRVQVGTRGWSLSSRTRG